MITRLGTLCRTGQIHFVNVQIMTYTNPLLPQQEIPPEWTKEMVFFAVCWCCCFCTITAVDIPPKMLKTRNWLKIEKVTLQFGHFGLHDFETYPPVAGIQCKEVANFRNWGIGWMWDIIPHSHHGNQRWCYDNNNLSRWPFTIMSTKVMYSASIWALGNDWSTALAMLVTHLKLHQVEMGLWNIHSSPVPGYFSAFAIVRIWWSCLEDSRRKVN